MYSFDARDVPTDPTPRERITRALAQLGADEAEVLAVVAERLVMGRAQYGALQLATDRRDFVDEGLQEAADLSLYLAMALIKKDRQHG